MDFNRVPDWAKTPELLRIHAQGAALGAFKRYGKAALNQRWAARGPYVDEYARIFRERVLELINAE